MPLSNQLFDLIAFVACCIGSVVFLALLAINIMMASKTTSSRVTLDRQLASSATMCCSALVGTLGAYWRMSGQHIDHPNRAAVASLAGMVLIAAGLVINRKQLKSALGAYVAANGGSLSEAFSYGLLHPGRALIRMGRQEGVKPE